MRQRPGTAKGIVFVTLEDEFRIANLVIYTDVGERDRSTLISARLMLAEGRIERETDHSEVSITHIICRKLIDRIDLLGALPLEAGPLNTGKPTPLRPGEAKATAGIPASQDFR